MRDGALIVGEKERSVAPDWAPQRSAELVVVKLILWLARGIREEIGGVHGVVAEKLEGRSMPLVRAGFRLQIDHPSRHVAVLGRISPSLHRKLADCVERNIEIVASSLRRGCRGNAVYQV